MTSPGLDSAKALYQASYHGKEKDVVQLLKSGTDINAQYGLYGNALQAASYRGNEELVELLLKGGANVNAQGGQYGNALQRASFRGDERLVELLLKYGADVTAQGGEYGSALQAASSMGHKKVVQLLKKGGAIFKARGDEQHDDALHSALSGGNDPKSTLKREADFGTRGDKEYGDTLHPTTSGVNEPKFKRKREADFSTRGNEKHDDTLYPTTSEGKDPKFTLKRETNFSTRGDEEQSLPRVALQQAAEDESEDESDLLETGYVPMPEMTGNDSSRSGYEIMSDSDEDFQISDSTATGYDSSDSSESGYEIPSDEDEFDSALTEYDSPLASLKDRISNPVKYFGRLKALTHLIYRRSTLSTYKKSYPPRTVAEKQKHFEPCPRYPESLKDLEPDVFKPLPDSDILQICQDLHNAFASDLLEILECRNVNAQAFSNLKTLQSDGFCVQKFSILTIDPYRHDVARLLPVDIQQTLLLLKEIESVLGRTVDIARRALRSTSSAKVPLEQALAEHDKVLLSIPRCTKFLNTLGLFRVSCSNLSISAVLRLVANTIDLAVASYAGAHLGRFDKEYLGEELAKIDVLGPFTSLHKSQVPLIKLSRCRLQCLDSFHNFQSVWVFSLSDWEPRGHLFLSTKVEDFADIWGPLWKVTDPNAHNSYTRYVVGNGCIYKWKPQEATPWLFKNETLCHWIPNTTFESCPERSSDDEKLIFPDIVDGVLDGHEALLIGAVAAGCERLAIKRDCKFNLDRARSALDHDGRVQMLGTVGEHTYRDSETYQLQAGHGGMGVSASKQYKRRGQSLKQALVELWTTTPELRDPRLLEDFYGLEVSLCTQNAQRIQLGRILGLDSMCQYLKSFRWTSDSSKQAYFDALKCFREDSDALQNTWERHNQYQDDFGRAVLICLKALEKTGINHKGQLNTFLSSEVTARPELIALEPKEHSWIGLLKDDENSCCMAVVGDECLEFKHELGSMCGRSGRSVLRTALVINSRNKPRGICKKYAYTHEAMDWWTSRWSVKNMEVSSDVWLGKHGTLRLLSHLPEGTLLMDWRAASLITTAMKSLIDKERPHREYSENIRKEARRTRPVPLFVISNP